MAMHSDEWVPAMLGLDAVPPSRKVRCPAHDERTPSCHVYPDHIHCHGCGAHFYLIGLAGHLWDRDPRNPEHFKELLQMLADHLGLERPSAGGVAA